MPLQVSSLHSHHSPFNSNGSGMLPFLHNFLCYFLQTWLHWRNCRCTAYNGNKRISVPFQSVFWAHIAACSVSWPQQCIRASVCVSPHPVFGQVVSYNTLLPHLLCSLGRFWELRLLLPIPLIFWQALHPLVQFRATNPILEDRDTIRSKTAALSEPLGGWWIILIRMRRRACRFLGHRDIM